MTNINDPYGEEDWEEFADPIDKLDLNIDTLSTSGIKDLIFKLHSFKPNEYNVDKIIEFLNICKKDPLVVDNVEWYILHLIDTVNYDENYNSYNKIIKANRDIVNKIRIRVVKQEKSGNFPKDAWNSGWTHLPLEEVIKMKENEKC